MKYQQSDKVICVAVFPKEYPGWSVPNGVPKEGKIYVVEGVSDHPVEGIGLILVGLPAIRLSTGRNDGFCHLGFRKLNESTAKHSASLSLTSPAAT